MIYPLKKIDVALDTNILCYLLDNTYEKLNFFIEKLSESNFVNLTCSQFVIYELIELRKFIHYSEEVKNRSGEDVNIEEIEIQRKILDKNWCISEIDYLDINQEIPKKVNDEIIEIYNDFGISYTSNSIHEQLWIPHQELVLNSKISKEDSLVLLSSTQPENSRTLKNLIFLTNDRKFYNSYSDKPIDIVMNAEVVNPIIYKINNIKLPNSGREINLLRGNETINEVDEFLKEFLFETLVNNSPNLLVGAILDLGYNKQEDILFFNLKSNLSEKPEYLTVLTKGLEIITLPKIESNFWTHKEEITDYPYLLDNGISTSSDLSIKLVDNKGKPLLDKETFDKINTKGNLLFLFPEL